LGVFLKVAAFVLLGIGAFLVYGAKLVAKFLYRSQDDEVLNMGDGNTVPSGEKPPADMQEYDSENPYVKYQPVDKKVLNIKMIGMILVIAGGILVLVSFG